ncbi:DDE Tnp IS1595 domain-containing protein, partial [Aphis craccivora]
MNPNLEGENTTEGIALKASECLVDLNAKRVDWILPGKLIISDCWKSYDCLKDVGYSMTVYHSIEFKNPESGAHTNNVEGMWSHAKASMTQYSRKKHFYAGYLAKSMFFKGCRSLGLNTLVKFFKLAAQVYDPNGLTLDTETSETTPNNSDSGSDDEKDDF